MSSQPPGTDITVHVDPIQSDITWSRAMAGAGDLVPKGFRDGRDASPGKLFLAAQVARMLEIDPMAAVMGLHIIDGKPTIAPHLMTVLVRRARHKLRVTTSGSVAQKTFEATATLIRFDDPDSPFVSTWNLDRAVRAGLVGKDNWVHYFEAMCKARAIGDVCRDGAEDALMGYHYTPDEFDAPVNEAGEMLEGEVVEESTQPSVPEPAPPAPVFDPVVADEWFPRITAATHKGGKDDPDSLSALFYDAREAGILELLYEPLDDGADPSERTFGHLFFRLRETLPLEQPAAP